jgi:hypothetical protein
LCQIQGYSEDLKQETNGRRMMMKTAELDAELKSLKETVAKLEKRVSTTEDIEAIKKLQRAYGYYLEHWEEENLTALWSHRDDITLEINAGGQYKGWEAIKKAFNFGDHYTAYGGVKKAPPEYLHILMPLNGIIDVEPDGINAKGRWYGFFLGALYRGGTLRALIGCGIWENEYIKEDGIWKFKKLFFNDIISSPLDEGWVKTPYLANPPHGSSPPPGPGTHFQHYPSGYIFPYHYKNPVTGK